MICKQCRSIIVSSDKRRLFCSRSCSAKFSNVFGRRPKSQNRRPCPDCGKEIRNKGTQTCLVCRNRRLRIATGKLLKKEVNRVRISEHARWVLKEHLASCLVCGYSFAVEAAHVKAVKSFSDETTLEEINRIENLLPLCPNHHLEFDRGKLTFETISALRYRAADGASFKR
jgi:HNH endonuclease